MAYTDYTHPSVAEMEAETRRLREETRKEVMRTVQALHQQRQGWQHTEQLRQGILQVRMALQRQTMAQADAEAQQEYVWSQLAVLEKQAHEAKRADGPRPDEDADAVGGQGGPEAVQSRQSQLVLHQAENVAAYVAGLQALLADTKARASQAATEAAALKESASAARRRTDKLRSELTAVVRVQESTEGRVGLAMASMVKGEAGQALPTKKSHHRMILPGLRQSLAVLGIKAKHAVHSPMATPKLLRRNTSDVDMGVPAVRGQ